MTILKRNLIRIYRKHRFTVVKWVVLALFIGWLEVYFINGVLARL